MTPFVDLTEREREIAHANFNAFKRRLERERVDERRTMFTNEYVIADVRAPFLTWMDKGE